MDRKPIFAIDGSAFQATRCLVTLSRRHRERREEVGGWVYDSQLGVDEICSADERPNF